MNALKTGALALTLIIVVPILLGFGMASETVEKEVLQESETVNLSDVVLNSTTDYFATYSGPQNNSNFIQQLYAQGGSEYTMAAPEYVSTSATYSSIPTYEVESASLSLDSGTTVSHSGISAYTVAVGDFDSGDAASTYNHDYVTVTNTLGVLSEYVYYVNGSYSGSGYINSSDTVFYLYRTGTDSDGDPLYLLEYGSTTVENVSCFYIDSDQTPTYTVYYRDATTVALDYTYYVISSSGAAVVPITYADGTTEYYYSDDLASIVYLNSTLYLDTDRFDEVEAYGICKESGYSTLTYYYNSTVSGVYADPSYGWSLPTYETPGSGVTAYYDYWSNGYVNGSVTFDVAFSGYGSVTFEPMESLRATAYAVITLTYSASGLTVTYDDGDDTVSVFLGQYAYAHLVIDMENEEITVGGMVGWSAFGSDPTQFNTHTFDFYKGEFTVILMTDVSEVATFRVDSARIVAGEFPSTEDYTLTVTDLYPDLEHYSVYINSIGIYGSSITVAGATLETPLKETVTVDYDEESDSWSTTIDGTTYTTSAAPSFYCDGEWSLTLTCTTYEYVTVSEYEWIPGAFAFDRDDFILCMILASVGVFVALGLAKGVRIGVLAVVCGAAGIIAFVIA